MTKLLTLIESIVCRHHGIEPSQLRNKTRAAEIVEPRHWCTYFILETTNMPQSRLAERYLQGHATTYNGYNKIRDIMEFNKAEQQKHREILIEILVMADEQGLYGDLSYKYRKMKYTREHLEKLYEEAI